MKKVILGLAVTAITLVACNSNKSTESKANNAVTFTNSDEKNLSPIKEIVKQYDIAKKGDKLVVVSGLTFGVSGASNMIFIEEI